MDNKVPESLASRKPKPVKRPRPWWSYRGARRNRAHNRIPSKTKASPHRNVNDQW